jgi:hypothetical protein
MYLFMLQKMLRFKPIQYLIIRCHEYCTLWYGTGGIVRHRTRTTERIPQSVFFATYEYITKLGGNYLNTGRIAFLGPFFAKVQYRKQQKLIKQTRITPATAK